MRKKQEIKTVSYVRVGDKWVNTDDLNYEQKKRLATELKVRYLNELMRGKVVFFPAEEGAAPAQGQ